MATLAILDLRVPTTAWNAVGFPLGMWRLGDTCVSIGDSHGQASVTAAVTGLRGNAEIRHLQPTSDVPSCVASREDMGLEAVDHLMVRTTEAESTLHSLAGALGVDVSVDANGERSVWIGSVRVDMVSTPDLSVSAEVWGVAFRVANIDVWLGRLGSDVLGTPKPARQQGQRVSVFRSSAGLGIPTALIDLRG